MATVTLETNRAVAKSRVTSQPIAQYFPTDQEFMSLPDPPSLPMDRIGRDIAIFLHEHPSLADKFGQIDLVMSSDADKSKLLERIKDELGIPKILRKTLGYVGP
jgi:hypothetical protein